MEHPRRRQRNGRLNATIDVVVIGAGQGGLSASYFLTQARIDHVVLDRGRIAHAWREERWDSFCLVTPNWTVHLPGAHYQGDDPDGFMLRDEFVRYMDDWATEFGAPVREGVDVRRITGNPGAFVVETSEGPRTARAVVVATATFQVPRIPAGADAIPGAITQLNAHQYKNPEDIPAGAVLIVGSGQTGCQFAEELFMAGRDVYLSVGRAGRVPRRYRGADCLEWQRDLKLLERTPDMLDSPADRFVGDPHLSGRDGGRTLSLHEFHARGINLLGRFEGANGRSLQFADDLHENMCFADQCSEDFIEKIETYIKLNNVDAPSPTAEEFAGGPPAEDWTIPAVRALDIEAAQLQTVIWATGFRYDFSWVEFDVLDDMDYPLTERGATSVPGLYFMGLNWMYKRKSGILYGVDEDAAYLGQNIADYLKAPVR